MIQFDWYVSKGLKPPTSYGLWEEGRKGGRVAGRINGFLISLAEILFPTHKCTLYRWWYSNSEASHQWSYPIGSMGLVYLPTFTIKINLKWSLIVWIIPRIFPIYGSTKCMDYIYLHLVNIHGTLTKFNIAPKITFPKVVFQPLFFRGYVKLPGCKLPKNPQKTSPMNPMAIDFRTTSVSTLWSFQAEASHQQVGIFRAGENWWKFQP